MSKQISTHSDLKDIQNGLTSNSDNYIKVGLNGLTGTTDTIQQEVQRLKKDGRTKKGTICNCCGQVVKLKTVTLNGNNAVCLLYMLKFFRYSDKAKDFHYYTSKDYFNELIDNKNLKYLVNGFQRMKYFDLIAPMPTSPDKVIYKKGYWTLTENGIKFAQREINVPKSAFVYNDNADSHNTDFVGIDDLLNDVGIKYEDII